MVNPQSVKTGPSESSQVSPPSTGPRGWLSLLARVAGWLIVPLYVAGICTSYVLQYRAGLLGDSPLENAVLLVGFSAFAVAGALLVAKRPANAVGWIMSAVALMVSISLAGDSYAAYVMVTRGRPDWLTVVGALTGSWYWFAILALVLIYMPLLFPDGRLPSPRWLPVAVLAGLGTLGIVVLSTLADILTINEAPGYEIDNPIGIEGFGNIEHSPLFGVMTALLFICIVGAMASVVVRFRRSRGVERQQMKWFVYAVALIPLIPTDDFLPGIISSAALCAVLIGLPTAIGIAVLRYRLYDIDVLINRTLVYGSLTALLVTAYVGSIVVLQATFRSLTGQDSQLTIVASTLAIAALFNPLRRRIQAFVDRRFYRRKYDAARILASFGARLRDETDLAELNEELLAVVRDTVQPAHASLWLRPDTASKKEDVPG
jgi:hypothetical protein